MLGKRVRLTHTFDMAPMVIHKMVGEDGVVEEKDRFKPKVWLVVFDSGKRVWIEGKYLEVIDD